MAIAYQTSAGEEAKQNNSLSLAQFTRLCKTFDWDGDEFINGLADTIYEHTFEEPFSKTSRLGFRVRNVDKRGLIVVSKIVDGNDALADKVGVNDTIIAVNGAPFQLSVSSGTLDPSCSAVAGRHSAAVWWRGEAHCA